MSDTKAQARQRAIDHMARLLQMNPIHEGTEIICARNDALGLAKKADATRPAPAEELRAGRRKSLEQLEAIRSTFWATPIEELNKQLSGLDSQGFVDLEAAVARLRVVAAHRDQFPALSQKPGFDGNFFSALKDVLIRSSRDTTVVRERVLSTFRNRSSRKRGRRMVELLKTEMPAIYALEADWFNTLYRQKAQPRLTLIKSSSRRPQAAAVGSNSGSRNYMWPVWIGVVALGSLFRGLAENSNHNRTVPYIPNIPSTQSHQFKDLPRYLRHDSEGEKPKPGESPGSSFSESEKRMWDSILGPSAPQSPAQPDSPRPFGIDEPFAHPKIFDSDGPGKKPDDRYPR